MGWNELNREKYEKNGFIGVFTRKHISTRITNLVAKTRIKPTQVTIFSLLVGISAAAFLSTGERTNLVVAGILIFISKIFDAVDGELARIKNLETKKGAWLDGISDRLKENLYIFAITFALFKQTANPTVWIYGFIAIIAIHMQAIVLEHTGRMDKGALQNTHSNFFLVRAAKRLGIKPQYLALQADVYLFIIYFGAVLNQLMYVLWFFMVVMNIYWIAIFFLVSRRKVENEDLLQG